MGLMSGLRAMFGGAQPAAAPPAVVAAPAVGWTPTFEQPIGYGPNGYVNRLMNQDYFATQATAAEAMRRLGATEMFQRIAPGNEGPLYTCSQLQWWLRWQDGLEMNAGTLAAYWSRTPESQFPGLAESFAKEFVALGRREAAQEARDRGYATIRDYFRGQFTAPIPPAPTKEGQ
jgi:hypothetical protein